ncbi:DUF4167 domain-containing protein [Rhodobacteraceae bacterium]|nr:DUF4167 domain-containing protein [Paracoccaceae bacterium]
MRSSKSRSRSKSNRQRSIGNVINRVFESSGPEGKVRGTPQQIIDKYLGLARDAQLSNDRVAEQNFLQHAEHYTRLLHEAQREMAQRQQHNNQGQNGNQNAGSPSNGGRDGADAGAGAVPQHSGPQHSGGRDTRHSGGGSHNTPNQEDDTIRHPAGEGGAHAGTDDTPAVTDDSSNLVETPETRSLVSDQGGPSDAGAAPKPRNTRSRGNAPKSSDNDASEAGTVTQDKPKRARKPRTPKKADDTAEGSGEDKPKPRSRRKPKAADAAGSGEAIDGGAADTSNTPNPANG